MLKKSWIVLAMTLAVGAGGHADPAPAPETFTLTASFVIYKCTSNTAPSNTAIDCQTVPGGLVNQNVSVTLDDCHARGSDNWCFGHWTQTLTADGNSLVGSITVAKDTPATGAARYAGVVISNPVGKGLELLPSTAIMFAQAKVGEDVTLVIGSPQLMDGTNVGYYPVVVVGPLPADASYVGGVLEKQLRASLLAPKVN